MNNTKIFFPKDEETDEKNKTETYLNKNYVNKHKQISKK